MNPWIKGISVTAVLVALIASSVWSGTLVEREKHVDSGVAGSIPVMLEGGIQARALIHMNPKDPAYACAKKVVSQTASGWDIWFIRHKPSRVWILLRDETRSVCGQAVTVLIDNYSAPK